MRILFTRFPLQSAYGGAEVQTLSLMEGLMQKGHAVGFLGSCRVLLEECVKRKIPSAKLEIGPPPVTKSGAISFLWHKRKMQKQLITALEQFKDVDVVCMLSLSEKLLATEWATTKGIKVLWIEHDRVGRWLTNNPWLPRLRHLSKLVTTVVVSELSKKIYLKLGWDEKNLATIPNGVDVRRFAGVPSSPALPPRGKGVHLGCIARLSREKGVDLLVKVVQQFPDVRLSIIGKGPEEARIRALIEKGHKQKTKTEKPCAPAQGKRINVYSTTPNLQDFYRSIDVLILPSRDHDPFGMVAAEAMMLGIPVLVTDACGIAGYLRDGEDVVIVPAGLEPALVTGISRLRDVQLRATIAAEGKKTAERRFSLSAMLHAYERLLSGK